MAGISKPFSSKTQAKKGRKAAQGWTNNTAGFKTEFRLTVFHCKSKHLQNWLGTEKNKEQFIGFLVQHCLPPKVRTLVELYTLVHFRCLCLSMLTYSNYNISGKQSHSRLLSSAGRSITILEHEVNYSKVQYVSKGLPEGSPSLLWPQCRNLCFTWPSLPTYEITTEQLMGFCAAGFQRSQESPWSSWTNFSWLWIWWTH